MAIDARPIFVAPIPMGGRRATYETPAQLRRAAHRFRAILGLPLAGAVALAPALV